MTTETKLLVAMNALLDQDDPEYLVQYKTILSHLIGEAMQGTPTKEAGLAIKLEEKVDQILVVALKYYLKHELKPADESLKIKTKPE